MHHTLQLQHSLRTCHNGPLECGADESEWQTKSTTALRPCDICADREHFAHVAIGPDQAVHPTSPYASREEAGPRQKVSPRHCRFDRKVKDRDRKAPSRGHDPGRHLCRASGSAGAVCRDTSGQVWSPGSGQVSVSHFQADTSSGEAPDPSISDAVCAIIYAAPRTELKELHQLREILMHKVSGCVTSSALTAVRP